MKKLFLALTLALASLGAVATLNPHSVIGVAQAQQGTVTIELVKDGVVVAESGPYANAAAAMSSPSYSTWKAYAKKKTADGEGNYSVRLRFN